MHKIISKCTDSFAPCCSLWPSKAKCHSDPSYCTLDLKLNFWAISIALALFMLAVGTFGISVGHIVKPLLVALLSSRKAFWCENLEVRTGIWSCNWMYVILTHLTNNTDFNWDQWIQAQIGNCSDMEKLTVFLELFLLTYFKIPLIPVLPLFFFLAQK